MGWNTTIWLWNFVLTVAIVAQDLRDCRVVVCFFPALSLSASAPPSVGLVWLGRRRGWEISFRNIPRLPNCTTPQVWWPTNSAPDGLAASTIERETCWKKEYELLAMASNFEEKVRSNLIETSLQTTVRHFFIRSIELLWKIKWNCHWQNSESFFIVRLDIWHSKPAGGRQRPRRPVIHHILIPTKYIFQVNHVVFSGFIK